MAALEDVLLIDKIIFIISSVFGIIWFGLMKVYIKKKLCRVYDLRRNVKRVNLISQWMYTFFQWYVNFSILRYFVFLIVMLFNINKTSCSNTNCKIFLEAYRVSRGINF